MAILTINVDEIAPEEELIPGNQLKPTETEMEYIAAGCRQTLSLLYGDELMLDTDCGTFLRQKADLRRWHEAPSADLPGLPEVCRHCSRKLNPPAKAAWIVCWTKAPVRKIERNGKRLSQLFPDLTGKDHPRIVFLASGGVFRGSFHIGMLGAMLALNIKPHLIVGSSVGTLMGAALGSVFKAKKLNGDTAARKQLHRMVSLFVEVGEKIALTRGFKAAVKDLGIRWGRSSAHLLGKMRDREPGGRGSGGHRRPAGADRRHLRPAAHPVQQNRRDRGQVRRRALFGCHSRFLGTDQGNDRTAKNSGRAKLGANLYRKEMRRLLVEDIPPSDHVHSALQPFPQRRRNRLLRYHG